MKSEIVFIFIRIKFETLFFEKICCLLYHFYRQLKECQFSNFIKNTKDLRQEFYEFIQNDMNTIEFNFIHRFENEIRLRQD